MLQVERKRDWKRSRELPEESVLKMRKNGLRGEDFKCPLFQWFGFLIVLHIYFYKILQWSVKPSQPVLRLQIATLQHPKNKNELYRSTYHHFSKKILNSMFNSITFLASHLSDGSSKAIIRTLGLQTGSSRAVTLTGSTLTFQTSTDSVGKTERGLRFILCSPSFNPYHLLSLSSFQFSLFPLSECEIQVNSFRTKPLHKFCFSLESGNSAWINLFILRGRECLKLFTFLMLDFELNILCKTE